MLYFTFGYLKEKMRKSEAWHQCRSLVSGFKNAICRAHLAGCIDEGKLNYFLLILFSLFSSYGDKTPKSATARLFSVVWIITGVTMCSILTATLSSALTSVTIERYDFTTGKTV